MFDALRAALDEEQARIQAEGPRKCREVQAALVRRWMGETGCVCVGLVC